MHPLFARPNNDALITSSSHHQRGTVLIAALLFLLLLNIIAISAFDTTGMEEKMSGNFKSINQSFFNAEAGLYEAMDRLRGNAVTNPNWIADSAPAAIDWQVYIGTASELSAQLSSYGGCTNPASACAFSRIQNEFSYVVQIGHKLNAAGDRVVFWGDSDGDGRAEFNTGASAGAAGIGVPVYTLHSQGYDARGSGDALVAEVARYFYFEPPAAIYAENDVNINGAQSVVSGFDICGGDDKFGLYYSATGTGNTTTLAGASPPVGAPSGTELAGSDLNIPGIIDSLKTYATDRYTAADAGTNPGFWGLPSLSSSAASCSSAPEIVYFDMGGPGNTLSLAGGPTGCGVLMVDGDLALSGGVSWYGLIIATGNIDTNGLGNNPLNVAGSMLSGGQTTINTLNGNIKVKYCSAAVQNVLENLQFEVLTWRGADL